MGKEMPMRQNSKLLTGQAHKQVASWARFPHVTHTLPKIKMLWWTYQLAACWWWQFVLLIYLFCSLPERSAEALTMTRVLNPEVVGPNPGDDDVIFRTVR